MRSVGIPLPPPFKGQNDQLPEFSVQNPFCVRMQNFENDSGIIRLRSGNKKWGILASYSAWRVTPFASKLIVVLYAADTRFYDASSGTLSLEHTAAGTSISPIRTLFFRDRLFIFGDDDFAPGGAIGPLVYDGTTYAAAGYSWPSSFTPYGGTVHKNRAYFIGLNSASFAYSEIDAISGATTRVDLSSLVSSSAYIYGIFSISLSENVTQQNVLVIVLSNGELLVYDGSYPNSASWSLSARLKISTPYTYNSFIEAKGDVFVLTQSEILSIRGIISRGYSAERQDGIGAAVEGRYRQIIRVTANEGIQELYRIEGAYDATNDRLIITIPKHIDRDTSARGDASLLLIYDFTLGAWYEETQTASSLTAFVSVAHFGGSNYLLGYSSSNAILMKLHANTNYLDDAFTSGSSTVGAPFLLRSAPAPVSRFGIVKADGLEVIMKSDIYPAINFKLRGDLGAQETAAQTTSGNGTNVTKAFVNLGMEANTIQYEISGTSTSSTTGIEIYATNMWVTPGDGVAR